jgi:hypothetical protein
MAATDKSLAQSDKSRAPGPATNMQGRQLRKPAMRPIAVLLILSLGGCATPPYLATPTYFKPGASTEDAARQLAKCKVQAASAPNSVDFSVTRDDCMRGEGYIRQNK